MNHLVKIGSLKWQDMKVIDEIFKTVKYEAQNSPYDEIKWAEDENGIYKETLKRFFVYKSKKKIEKYLAN